MIEWISFPHDDNRNSDGINNILNNVMLVHLVVAMVISITLNPFLTKYYYQSNKKHSTVKILFCLIAITDFMTNSLPLVHLLYFVGSQGPVFTVYGTYHYNGVHAMKHRLFLVGLFFICIYGCISQVLTSSIALMRAINIIKPFSKINQKYVYLYICFYVILMMVSDLGGLLANIYHLNPTTRLIFSQGCLVLSLLQCVIGVASSLTSALMLIVSRDSRNQRRIKSCTIVVLMNIPYVIAAAMVTSALFKLSSVNFMLVYFVGIPSLTSAVNPLIALFVNKKFKAHLGRITKTFVCRGDRTASVMSVSGIFTNYKNAVSAV